MGTIAYATGSISRSSWTPMFGWLSHGVSSRKLLDYRSTKTDFVRRKKPINLMASQTTYSHDEEIICDNSVTFVGKDGFGRPFIQTQAVGDYALESGRSLVIAPSIQLTNRLLNRVKDQKVNLALALAEYSQTADLFSDISTTVASSYRSFRRGRWGDAVREIRRTYQGRPRRAHDAWLQIQFGLAPLLSDLDGAVKELENAKKEPSWRRVTERGSEQRIHRNSFPGKQSTPAGSSLAVSTRSARLSCVYAIEPHTQSFGRCGFYNPLDLLYQAAPWTFVIDYLIPVGSWLSSLDALVGVGPAYACRTDIHNYDHTYSVLGVKRTHKWRQTSRSIPGLAPEWPGYAPSDSLKKVVNCVALLRQLGSAR